MNMLTQKKEKPSAVVTYYEADRKAIIAQTKAHKKLYSK